MIWLIKGEQLHDRSRVCRGKSAWDIIEQFVLQTPSKTNYDLENNGQSDGAQYPQWQISQSTKGIGHACTSFHNFGDIRISNSLTQWCHPMANIGRHMKVIASIFILALYRFRNVNVSNV